MSQKKHLYDFLNDLITAAAPATPLHGVKLRFDHFDITKEDDAGIHLSNVISDPRLKSGGIADEYDARLIVVTYVRVAGPQRETRLDEYERSNGMMRAVVAAILADEGLGGRTCNTRVGKQVDDFESLAAGQMHAINNLYVVLNSTGRQLEAPFD